MAIYVPSGNWERAAETCHILKAEEKDGYISYVIEVHVSPFKWHVNRRYRQFVELHEKIVKNFSLDKNLLPPKKVFGNKSESFVNERQKALEFYLQTVIHQFSLLPEPLAKFLDFQNYEIRGITAALAETFFSQGDLIISQMKIYQFSPLQLHAITERLKLTEPTCYSNNSKQDIAHLVEFITQLKHLKIKGSNDFYKESNIIPNSLSFDLALFKYLEVLEINGCNLEGNLTSVDVLRKKLKMVDVHRSIKDLSVFLLCGILHWSPNSSSPSTWPIWHCITHANFSHNSLIKIDTSIKLLSSVIHLDLSSNEIEVIENLESLSHLSCLNLSNNKITNLESLHTKLGNIQTLHLSSNKIKSLQGLSKIFSVIKLYLDSNLISSLDDIAYLSKLPCVEVLNLQNNPVTLNVDYRSHVLLAFGSQASEIELDGLKTTEKEIDTVLVLQALKQARGEFKSSSASDDLLMQANCRLSSIHVEDRFSSSNAVKGDTCSGGKFTSQKPLANLAEASEFRQHVETLRRIGGSDWLRLLNEMNASPKSSLKGVSEKCFHIQPQSSDLQLHTVPLFEKNSQLSSHHIKALAITSEIAYPECISLLDNTNENFRHQFLTALIKHRAYSNSENESIQQIHDTYSSLLSETKLVWLVLLVLQESSVYEIPVCLIMFKAEMILLKVTSFSKDISSDSCCDSLLFPEFAYLRSLLPVLILSVIIGPCNAYASVKIKESGSTETLIFLFNNTDMTDLFIEYCTKFYNIIPVYMQHPFADNILNFEEIHARLPLTNIYFQSQILFNQRVLVSKVFHKCHFGILHYVFITPSHIVLVEERLHIPQIVGLDTTVQPQFHICALVSVHTNIKQIKDLKDIDEETDNTNLSETEPACYEKNVAIENKRLEVLYKCGSWLIIEFESAVILYLKFFFLKQRNEFLEAFLYARSQK